MKTLLFATSWFTDFFQNLTAEDVRSWFTYNPDQPLLFNSGLFLGFFLIFYIIYVFTREHRHFRSIYVLVFSLFLYYKAGGMYFILLLALAIINYILSYSMHKSENKKKRKFMLTFTVIVNLAVLAYYKYTNFLIENFNEILHGNLSFQNIILPIGISFFTFQAISYAVDLYRKQIDPARNVLDYSFYLCFFPQLVAGPIVRAKEFMPQMYNKLNLSKEDASRAAFMIMTGLIKKVVISDYISLNFVDRVFDAPMSYTSFENLMAVYGYTLQIYCDFSGYSDMAIGLALLMGFTFPKNFDSPYKSQSITEFWRRWHISLSSWLRDYLYIPLGGNRKGKIRTYVNLFLTMLIGGLWHGASWKFVVWGGLHGTILGVERFFKQFIKIPDNFFTRFICILLTFHFVAFCWIFFRANSFELAGDVISNIGNLTFAPEQWLAVLEGYKNVFIIIAIGYILHFLPVRLVDWVKNGFIQTPLFIKAVFIGLIFWVVFATAASGPQPFIYFQF